MQYLGTFLKRKNHLRGVLLGVACPLVFVMAAFKVNLPVDVPIGPGIKGNTQLMEGNEIHLHEEMFVLLADSRMILLLRHSGEFVTEMHIQTQVQEGRYHSAALHYGTMHQVNKPGFICEGVRGKNRPAWIAAHDRIIHLKLSEVLATAPEAIHAHLAILAEWHDLVQL